MLTRVDPENTIDLDARQHAVVIGAGFGGLAAAVRLGAKGYRVTVLDQLDQPGGRACVFRQDGFTFDAGPTIITLPFLFEELWEMCGKKLEDHVTLKPLDPFYTILYDDGSHFHAKAGREAMRQEVARISPDDLDGYDRFMVEAEKIYRLGFEELGHASFHALLPMLKAIPGFVRFRADKSVYATASKFMKDERLRFAYSFHPLFIGGNPFEASSIYALVSYLEGRWGVHFAQGGTTSLVHGLVDLIKGQGSTVQCNAQVSEITVEDGRATGVTLADGKHVAADIVVSNADATWTYRNLVPSKARKRWSDKKIDKARYSMSLFVWYFGTDRTYSDVDHHTLVLGPRYRGLIEDIFTNKILAEDFSLYLHRPTATDPLLAPEGCESFYVLSPVPNLLGDVDWDVEAEPYRQRIEKVLTEKLLPDLKDHVVSSKIMTPLDFRDTLSSLHGAAFGLEPILTQSAWFRPHNKSEDIEGLYMVGASTHPGAGVPGVLSSARVLDEVVPDALTNL